MYFFLTREVKRLLINEIRDFWATHPRYQNLVDNIQGKYSFKDRPQQAIVVKTGSASKVQFSPDNFMGTGQSYVTLAKLPGYPGVSVEWIREDSLAIQVNRGSFPSPPGVYYCEMTEEDAFHVDPLLDVRAETLSMVTESEGLLPMVPFEGSLRLYENPSSRMLRPGTDYTVGEDGVTIYFSSAIPSQVTVVADYRYAGVTTGPWVVLPYSGYHKPIPGCVLAFGGQFAKGDRFAVIVSNTREDAFLEYGGKWELSVDIDIIARDSNEQTVIADRTTMFLWAQLRSRLIDRGIDIQDVSMGGESEDYFYNSTISMTIQADWSMYEPLIPKILSFEETVGSLPNVLAMTPFRDPFFTTRYAYPTIG